MIHWPFQYWHEKTIYEKRTVIRQLIVVGVIAVLFPVSCAILYQSERGNGTVPEEPSPVKDAVYVVTKAKFDALADGMTYEQVGDIIGSPGEQIGHQYLIGIADDIYQWRNWDGSLMIAMFQNDHLISKNQINLP